MVEQNHQVQIELVENHDFNSLIQSFPDHFYPSLRLPYLVHALALILKLTEGIGQRLSVNGVIEPVTYSRHLLKNAGTR